MNRLCKLDGVECDEDLVTFHGDWVRCPDCGSERASMYVWPREFDFTLSCPGCETDFWI